MDLEKLLNEIDQLKKELEGLQPLPADQEERLQQTFYLEWTYQANALEGNPVTLGETYAYLLHEIKNKRRTERDYIDIKGYYNTILALNKAVRQQVPLTDKLMRELHKMMLVEPYEIEVDSGNGQAMTRMMQIGQYKSEPNHTRTTTGMLQLFSDPRRTPQLIEELIEWYNAYREKLHPLILAAAVHARFLEIRPFEVGNRRVAQLLLNLILMQNRFRPLIIDSAEQELLYDLALELANGDDDLEPLVLYLGIRLRQSMLLTIRGAKGGDIRRLGEMDGKIGRLLQRLENAKRIDNMLSVPPAVAKLKFQPEPKEAAAAEPIEQNREESSDPPAYADAETNNSLLLEEVVPIPAIIESEDNVEGVRLQKLIDSLDQIIIPFLKENAATTERFRAYFKKQSLGYSLIDKNSSNNGLKIRNMVHNPDSLISSLSTEEFKSSLGRFKGLSIEYIFARLISNPKVDIKVPVQFNFEEDHLVLSIPHFDEEKKIKYGDSIDLQPIMQEFGELLSTSIRA